MARFKYVGRDRKGKTTGALTSPSKKEAMIKLRNQGIRIVEIKEVQETLFTKEILRLEVQ